MPEAQETIGVILVHGIGEQRRFEHLESQGRLLIEAFRRLPDTQISVEILQAPGGVHYAEQNTWASSPSVRIGLKDPRGYREILLHEVWWADVNEPYSLAKQFRFWLWGLSVWSYPRKATSCAPGFEAMIAPVVPGLGAKRRLLVRLELFGISTLFLMTAFPLGIGVVLAKRLLNFSAPDLVQTIVNYVSGVKLYNQRRRRGAKLIFNTDNDFIDTLDEPPRVSIRRRMVETMVDVALQKYSRWYVLAHSLGSVVAQNGLMEPAETLAHYLDKEKWDRLRTAGWCGINPAQSGDTTYFAGERADRFSLPRRPTWLDPDAVVYRKQILSGFKGLLTYGSPLEKFAALWPARVAINESEPHFQAAAEWINVYDPIDPVSGVLCAFSPPDLPANCAPRLVNIGYRTDWKLLYAHLRYLQVSKSTSKTLGNAVAHWLAHGGRFRAPSPPRDWWFLPLDRQHRWRKILSGVEWAVVAVIAAVLGALTVPPAYSLLRDGVQHFPGWLRTPVAAALDGVTSVINWVKGVPPPSIWVVILLLTIAVVCWTASEVCEQLSRRGSSRAPGGEDSEAGRVRARPKIRCTIIRWIGVILLGGGVGAICLEMVVFLTQRFPSLPGIANWLLNQFGFAVEFAAYAPP
jgi:hypothetical protein